MRLTPPVSRAGFRFAPLRGATFAALDVPGKPAEADSVVLLDEEGLHVRSEAALRILMHLGGVWGVLGRLGRAAPRGWRDGIYRALSRHRHAIFGGAEACLLPALADRARLLP